MGNGADTMGIVRQRREKIVDILREREEADIGLLVKKLNSSEATIRRDLNALEMDDRIIRVRGGARLINPESLVTKTFEQKRQIMAAEKERIAKKAAEFVEPGMVIAMDSGTTIWRVAAALKEKGSLQIITSALAVVEELGSIDDMAIHLIGGKFRLSNLDFVGPMSISAVSGFHADVAIIAVDALIAGKGTYGNDEDSAALTRAIGKCAEKRIVVADHTKIGARGYCQILSNTEIDILITDTGINPELVKELLKESFELIMA
ncbi:MAG: DeoR/GlpR transcriptional regulator [Planctomycetota bacterium]|nr:MAG: DeoR/GlpR transcriptional regulator [Planctomycetota bacterium]